MIFDNFTPPIIYQGFEIKEREALSQSHEQVYFPLLPRAILLAHTLNFLKSLIHSNAERVLYLYNRYLQYVCTSIQTEVLIHWPRAFISCLKKQDFYVIPGFP